MSESFGARLRQQRERQQIELATIAEETKIKRSLLEELEQDKVSSWPGGIFRRSFIRSYAHAIGLDPNDVVREFLELYPDPTEEAEAAAAAADAAQPGGTPSIRLRYLVDSAIGSLSRLRSGAAQSSPEQADLTHARPPSPPDHAADATRARSRTIASERARPAAAAKAAPPDDLDLLAVAALCTELGRLDNASESAMALHQAARILGAVGLIVWKWDAPTNRLRPALAHGYSDKVLAQLPPVGRDASNATAAAFRTTEPCVVEGDDGGNGALVVPLMTPAGCEGVLAIEVRNGCEQTACVRALATIFAAQLARVVAQIRPFAARTTDSRDRAELLKARFEINRGLA